MMKPISDGFDDKSILVLFIVYASLEKNVIKKEMFYNNDSV